MPSRGRARGVAAVLGALLLVVGTTVLVIAVAWPCYSIWED